MLLFLKAFSYLYASACVCTCTYILDAISQSWLSFLMDHTLTLFFTGTWKSPTTPCWLSIKPQGSLFFCLLSTGITKMSHHAWSFIWVLGIKFRSSCLQNKHFTNSWVHAFLSTLIFFYDHLFLKKNCRELGLVCVWLYLWVCLSLYVHA